MLLGKWWLNVFLNLSWLNSPTNCLRFKMCVCVCVVWKEINLGPKKNTAMGQLRGGSLDLLLLTGNKAPIGDKSLFR